MPRPRWHERLRLDYVRPILGDVELDQRSRVDVEDHRRSSMIARPNEPRRTAMGRRAPLGFSPDHAANPSATMARRPYSCSTGFGGMSKAMGSPRCVTTSRSPSATRRKYVLSRSRSSRTPTVVILSSFDCRHIVAIKCTHVNEAWNYTRRGSQHPPRAAPQVSGRLESRGRTQRVSSAGFPRSR